MAGSWNWVRRTSCWPRTALTVLMAQLKNFQRLIIVLSIAPLGLIGVVMALQFGPTLFLSMYGGLLADRYLGSKRAVKLGATVLAPESATGVPPVWVQA